ncbi:DnaJ domain-containing protein [Woodsholea maritima]|uniref:DnaJ domain-containing protein n=1 Tax=Woodsholea maritima TaxID=240237 RepID=UPI0003A830EF|nr:DnaJ domain-containing protein [Woodsholea maritima]
MTTCTLTPAEAYQTLGLAIGASPAEVKRAFRVQVKDLHPDVVAPTPATLKALAQALAAYRTLEQHGQHATTARHMANDPKPVIDAGFLDISEAEAVRGVVRTADAAGKRVIIRVPAGAYSGQILYPEGEPYLQLRLRVVEMTASRAQRAEPAPSANTMTVPMDAVGAALDNFVDQFARPSPARRFANWARARNAA